MRVARRETFRDAHERIRLEDMDAKRYSVSDYLSQMENAGFQYLQWDEHSGDRRLADEVPEARKYMDVPLLLTVTARRH